MGDVSYFEWTVVVELTIPRQSNEDSRHAELRRLFKADQVVATNQALPYDQCRRATFVGDVRDTG